MALAVRRLERTLAHLRDISWAPVTPAQLDYDRGLPDDKGVEKWRSHTFRSSRSRIATSDPNNTQVTTTNPDLSGRGFRKRTCPGATVILDATNSIDTGEWRGWTAGTNGKISEPPSIPCDSRVLSANATSTAADGSPVGTAEKVAPC